MLDETLPSSLTGPRRYLAPPVIALSTSTHTQCSKSVPMSSLLDQSALTDLADRLVAAARRAGADAADAVAVRSVSLAVEVREGAVEESERSEGDDVGLRVFVGSPPGGGVDQRRQDRRRASSPSARSPWRGSRPRTRSPALPIRRSLRATLPDLDLLDPDLPTVAQLEERAQRAESAGLAVKGVTKSGGASASAGIGGMVLVTSHGFRGAYLNSRQSVSMTAIAGEGTAMERDYDYSSALHARRSRAAREDRAHGRRARGRARSIRARSRPARAGRVRPRVAGSLVGHLASAINGSCGRAQDELSQGQARRAAVPAGHPHRRRSAAPARLALAAVRCRRRRRPSARGGRGRRADIVVSRLRDRARTQLDDHRPCPARRLLDAVARGRAICISSRARNTADALMADIADGFYVTDLIGMGVNG